MGFFKKLFGGDAKTELPKVSDTPRPQMNKDELNWQLLEAAAENEVSQVKLLLDSGADIDCTTDDGWTPLVEAVLHGPELTRLLLSRGANPNIASVHGYTALHRAAGHGNVEVVQLLLDAGADTSAQDEAGQTAHDMAMHGVYLDAEELIARRLGEQSRQAGRNRVVLEGMYATVMVVAPYSSKNYHLVCVEFDDGTRLQDAKVFDKCELELPSEYISKKIKELSVNLHQP